MQELSNELIEVRLKEMGIAIPMVGKSLASYQPFVVENGLVFISGQLPMDAGELRYRGQLGTDVGLEEGQAAARLCVLNVLAQLREACGGDWSRVKRCVRLGGFVSATPNFCDHPKVINGASELVVELLGDVGQHARAAVGCSSLPMGAAVEVEAVFRIK